MIVDRAVYRDGRRTAEPDDFGELHAACKAGDAVAWLGLYEPDAEEFSAMAREFDLHELAVEDAVKAHQRPKLERYGDTLFLVVRPARYVDETETVLFGEVAIFVGPQFVITVRHGDAPELSIRPRERRLEPQEVVRAVLDEHLRHNVPRCIRVMHGPSAGGVGDHLEGCPTDSIFGELPKRRLNDAGLRSRRRFPLPAGSSRRSHVPKSKPTSLG